MNNAFPLVEVKLTRGVNIEGCESSGRQIRAEMASTEAWAPPLAEPCATAIAAFWAPLFERGGKPRLTRGSHYAGNHKYRPADVLVSAQGAHDTVPTAPSTLAILYRFHRKEVEAEIRADLEEWYSSHVTTVMPAHEKERRLAELREKLLETERVHAALIWQALAAGEEPEFPKDLSVIALLGLPAKAPPKRKPDAEQRSIPGGRYARV